MDFFAWLASDIVQSNANKICGVLIALIGLGVTSPSGTDLFLRRSGAMAKQQLGRLRGRLARFIPGLRRSVTGTLDGTLPALQVSFTGKVQPGRKYAPAEDATIEERLALLADHVKHLESRLWQVDEAHHAQHSKTQASIDALRLDLREEVNELRNSAVQESQYVARIDARGLIVVAFGIVLNGIPEFIAMLPWAWPWVSVAGACGVSLLIAGWTIRDYLRVRPARLALERASGVG